jgi:hypothetical protein
VIPTIKVDSQSSRSSYHIQLVYLDDMDSRTIDAWADLEQRSLEANAYLSPHFVLPSVHCLDSGISPLFMLIERVHGGSHELAGFGAFTVQSPNIRFPLPYLRAYSSNHSYLTGLLIDRDHAEQTIEAFFDFLGQAGSKWRGIEFQNRSGDGELCRLLESFAKERCVFWSEYSKSQRAVLLPSRCNETYIARQAAGSRIRCKQKLSERGDVTWRMLSGNEVQSEVIERFLDLEHSGWKKEKGTSLRSKSSHEQFFREMIANFRADGNVFFTELRVGEVAVASTSHIISGNTGFAFKGGWHADYAKWSPGILNELELIRNAPEMCRNLVLIDSGAVEGSFIDQLWEDHRLLKTGMFLTNPIARFVASPINRMRQIKRNLGAIFCKTK